MLRTLTIMGIITFIVAIVSFFVAFVLLEKYSTKSIKIQKMQDFFIFLHIFSLAIFFILIVFTIINLFKILF